MKKVLVKKKVIDIPYSPATDESPEIQEVSHLEVIREFQSEDTDLDHMLSMESSDVVLEVVDITAEYENEKKAKKEKKDKEDALKAVDHSKDFTVKELNAYVRQLVAVLKDKGIL